MNQVWKCPKGHERTKTKAGASTGSRAVMRCGDCGEDVLFECVEATDDGDDDGGVPWDT